MAISILRIARVSNFRSSAVAEMIRRESAAALLRQLKRASCVFSSAPRSTSLAERIGHDPGMLLRNQARQKQKQAADMSAAIDVQTRLGSTLLRYSTGNAAKYLI